MIQLVDFIEGFLFFCFVLFVCLFVLMHPGSVEGWSIEWVFFNKIYHCYKFVYNIYASTVLKSWEFLLKFIYFKLSYINMKNIHLITIYPNYANALESKSCRSHGVFRYNMLNRVLIENFLMQWTKVSKIKITSLLLFSSFLLFSLIENKKEINTINWWVVNSWSILPKGQDNITPYKTQEYPARSLFKFLYFLPLINN